MNLELAARELVPLLLACAGGLAAFYFYVYRREARQAVRLTGGRQLGLWLLRITVAALVLGALSRPQRQHAVVTTRAPVVPVLLDVSASMGFPASEEDPLVRQLPAEQRDRFRAAREAIERIKASLSETHDVRLYGFANAPEFFAELPQRKDPSSEVPAIRYVRRVRREGRDGPVEEPLRPDGRFSYVGSSVVKAVEALAGERVSAVVLLSDGQRTGGTPLPDVAREIRKRRGMDLPVHAVTLGSRHPLTDLRIDEVNVAGEASLGDVLSFHVQITNQLADRLGTTLRALEKNAEDDSARYVEVARRVFAASEDRDGRLTRGRHRIELPLIPEVEGLRRFRFELPVDPREINAENNSAEVTVRIVKRTLRVLLICGEPQREYFYMVPALLRDPIIQLSTFLQAADVDYVQQGNEVIERLPETLDAWVRYDVVVLYDVDPNGLTVQQVSGIEHMVAKGGGLLLVAGRTQGLAKLIQVHAAKVRGLLPVEVDKNLHPNHDAVYHTPFRAERTAQGRTHPILLLSARPETNEAVWRTFPELYWHHPVLRIKPKAIPLLRRASASWRCSGTGRGRCSSPPWTACGCGAIPTRATTTTASGRGPSATWASPA
jgi:hypothetical protein